MIVRYPFNDSSIVLLDFINGENWEDIYKKFEQCVLQDPFHQLQNILNEIQTHPTSRRLIFYHEKALIQFSVRKYETELSCCLYDRFMFNIAALCLQLLVHLLKPTLPNLHIGEMIYFTREAAPEPLEYLNVFISDDVVHPWKDMKMEHWILFQYDIPSKSMKNCPSYDMSKMEDGEMQYVHHLSEILKQSSYSLVRGGARTLSKFGIQMVFDLSDGTLPLFTIRKLFFRGIVEELLWFISGSTDTKVLSQKNVKIWDKHSSREYLDSVGLKHHETGQLGPTYGFQWRHDQGGKGQDQLQDAIDALKSTSSAIICAWYPPDIPKMALPPCHCAVRFDVRDGQYLDTTLFQRSADLILGAPFNTASYALLTHLMSFLCQLSPGILTHNIGDAHIYAEHVPGIQKIMTERKPMKPFPKLQLCTENKKNINDFNSSDFHLLHYEAHPVVKFELIS